MDGREAAAAYRVLARLREADGPLGKRDLLARAAVPESAWPRVIGALIDSGRVEREGALRGAVSMLPAG